MKPHRHGRCMVKCRHWRHWGENSSGHKFWCNEDIINHLGKAWKTHSRWNCSGSKSVRWTQTLFQRNSILRPYIEWPNLLKATPGNCATKQRFWTPCKRPLTNPVLGKLFSAILLTDKGYNAKLISSLEPNRSSAKLAKFLCRCKRQ